MNGVQVSYMSTGSVENGGFSPFLKICQSGGSLSSGSSLKEINLSSLETGYYMLSVETEKQKVNKKIIKR
ncbi:T9SS type A sorting domain-containing protein [Chryseobacterium fistulae]|uniref:T9SS type A sorting domain-containing protein n=1 Tax=Chryseobacterium fistulae TaxID=2675058 RepID=UPI001E41C0BD|nr:T9SS type A sorting domain-containing protein [Chryseobacterium fistulae]